MKKIIWLTIFFAVLLWSAINPHDRYTWFLEVVPALIGFVALLITYSRPPPKLTGLRANTQFIALF